jgi:molecular chaperone GrpE (heat shock protein)
MRDAVEPKLTKWPFLLGDALLLGAVYFIYAQSKLPLGLGPMALGALCLVAVAALSVTPFLLEYRAKVKLAEANGLAATVSQIQNLEAIAAQISGATGRWQTAQEAAEKTAASAKSIAERMAVEAKAFAEFMQKVNDSEKSNLRLEVDKLRRAETEWLQALVRMLDHVYALHTGGVRSGQPHLIEQLTHFQNACREAGRRVGLSPFVAEPAERFDAQRHQPLDGNEKPVPGATVVETVATGYTFQGRLLRPALVRVQNAQVAENSPVAETQPASVAEEAQNQLELGAAEQPVG